MKLGRKIFICKYIYILIKIQFASSKIVKLVQNITISWVGIGVEVRERTGFMEGDGE